MTHLDSELILLFGSLLRSGRLEALWCATKRQDAVFTPIYFFWQSSRRRARAAFQDAYRCRGAWWVMVWGREVAEELEDWEVIRRRWLGPPTRRQYRRSS